MMEGLNIKSWCSIDGRRTVCDGRELFCAEGATPREYLVALYRHLGVDYPKFFKMDLLSMGGVLASEILFAGHRPDPHSTALVFANSASSLEKDREFQSTIATTEYFPSPAVFVYTLPNIVLGEISIRHGLHGDNIFLVSERFDARAVTAYLEGAVAEGVAKEALVGWLEADGGKLDVRAALVATSGEGTAFNEENLKNIFH